MSKHWISVKPNSVGKHIVYIVAYSFGSDEDSGNSQQLQIVPGGFHNVQDTVHYVDRYKQCVLAQVQVVVQSCHPADQHPSHSRCHLHYRLLIHRYLSSYRRLCGAVEMTIVLGLG